MAQILVRQLSDEVHRALKVKAEELGKSAEALAREILASNLISEDGQKLGDQLVEIWSGADLEGIRFERDEASYKPIAFE